MPNPTRNVSLTAHYSSFLDEQVKTGRYQNASEVVRDGLRLMEDRQREREAKLARLRAAVQLGLDQADRGEAAEVTDVKAFFDDLEAEVEAEVDEPAR